jgi:diguanylate cyclase (GGDEF)-like protein
MFLKKTRPKIISIAEKLIVPVSPEIKVQYSQLQLQHSVHGMIFFGVVEIVLRLINLLISKEFSAMFASTHENFYFTLLIYIAVLVVIIILTNILFRNERNVMALTLCYLFAFIVYIFSIYNMIYARTNMQFLFFFASTLFMNINIFDFKPIMSILPSLLFYAAAFGILTYMKPDELVSYQLYITYVFLAIVTVKIFYYNSRVKSYKLNFELKFLSKTDELTGLDNRRSLLEYMDFLWKQCSRLKLSISIFMIDIDFFKKYNDLFGHIEGDKALIAVAQCLKKEIKRKTDFVSRYGGEEFVCLLPYTDQEGAIYFARKLVKTIEDLKIAHPMNDRSGYLTISIGVSSTIPDMNDLPVNLMDNADKALYNAKGAGRNQAVLYSG